MSAVETTAAERPLLRRAGQLHVRADGRVYINAHGYQQMAARAVVESLLAKELMVRDGSKFRRTAAGDAALAAAFPANLPDRRTPS